MDGRIFRGYLDNSIAYHANKFNEELLKHGKEIAQFCGPLDHLLKGYVHDDTKAIEGNIHL